MDMLQKKKKPTQCDEPEFRQQLLGYIKEMPFIGLFGDVRGTTKYVTQHSMAAADHHSPALAPASRAQQMGFKML